MRYSIIVPVYNVEKYLPKCFQSLRNQSFSDYEIIVIDDGSTDNSGKLCNYYATLDSRIRVYHKDNGGLSDSRNYGLDKAKGDYIVFVDSDDWIESSALAGFEKVINNKDIDIIITRMTENYLEEGIEETNDAKFIEFLGKPLEMKRAVEWICKKSQNAWPATKYIVSRKLIEEHRIRFLKNRLHEDMDWTSNCCYYAKKYCGYTESWYHHRMNREGSITSSLSSKHLIDMIEVASIHYNCPTGVDEKIHSMVFIRFMESVYAWLRYLRICEPGDISIVAKVMRDNSHIFEIAPSLKHKIFVLVYRIIGAKNALMLLSKLYGEAR